MNHIFVQLSPCANSNLQQLPKEETVRQSSDVNWNNLSWLKRLHTFMGWKSYVIANLLWISLAIVNHRRILRISPSETQRSHRQFHPKSTAFPLGLKFSSPSVFWANFMWFEKWLPIFHHERVGGNVAQMTPYAQVERTRKTWKWTTRLNMFQNFTPSINSTADVWKNNNVSSVFFQEFSLPFIRKEIYYFLLSVSTTRNV
jgi:hypothetical protein